MDVIRVTDDRLASVLFMDFPLEGHYVGPSQRLYPEPYRGHSDLLLQVDFDTYKDFIGKYLDQTTYMLTETATLKACLESEQDETLMHHFYVDVAGAVAKELFYSQVSGGVTGIVHRIEGADVLSGLVQMGEASLASNLKLARQEFIDVLDRRGFKLTKYICDTYPTQLSYAVLLYAMGRGVFGIPFLKWNEERSVLS